MSGVPYPAYPAYPPYPADPADRVSLAANRNLPSTRAGGQDDVSSKQTPSKYEKREQGGTLKNEITSVIIDIKWAVYQNPEMIPWSLRSFW